MGLEKAENNQKPVQQRDTPLVWLLMGQKTGDNNQILSLIDALDWPYTIKHIINHPWELLTNLSLGVTLAGMDRQKSSILAPPWPDLVISAGRRNEPIAGWIKRRSGGNTRLIHIGRPWSSPGCWDLVVTTPQYFLPEGKKIQHNQLPLHLITRERLDAEKVNTNWPWSKQSRPYMAVMLGGDSGPFVFTEEKGRRMGTLVNQLAAESGGSVLITDSRRTPQKTRKAFLSQIEVPYYQHSWSSPEENPYQAFLAQADQLVVTGESMSMLAEASATGKPLYIFDLTDRQKPWWLYLHNYRNKPLSHRLGMVLAPRRFRRDISRIQAWLVKTGRAQWLENWRDECFIETLKGSPPENPQIEAIVTANRIRKWFET